MAHGWLQFDKEDRRWRYLHPQQRLRRLTGVHLGHLPCCLPHDGGLPRRTELREDERLDHLPAAGGSSLLSNIIVQERPLMRA
jgi:hypothetical protein